MSLEINYRDEVLTLTDGIKLKARLWIPDGEGPWPALLMRQPYGREIASTVTYAHPVWWARHGFLVIIQDVRGQGDSEGKFIGFEQESSDTTETHKWVRSLPECNGLLGTYGFSYQGLTQLLGEPGSRPPECLAPAMTGLNEGAHWSNEGGAFWWHLGIAWGLQLAAQKLSREKNLEGWAIIRESLESKRYLTNGLELLKKYDSEGMAIKWMKTSESFSKDWKIHEPLKEWLKQPMLLLGGWWDPHLRGILEINQKAIEAGGNPDLYIGPATHLQWWEETNNTQLDFFNRHLKFTSSKKNNNSIRLWNMTGKTWQPKQPSNLLAKNISFFLSSKGLACNSSKDGKLIASPNKERFINIVHDPWRPVPSIGGHLSPNPGEANRALIDMRGDVATFTSKPFNKEEVLESTPTLEIQAKADKEGFDLCVALSIFFEEQNEANQLSTGFLRIIGENAKIFTQRKVILQPFLASFPKGSQIRISISGSSWPAIAINPGSINKPCISSNPNCSITTISIDLSKSKIKFNPIFSN